jgi:hypothetical protein
MHFRTLCAYLVIFVLVAEPCLPSVNLGSPKPKRAALCGAMSTDCGMACCRAFDNQTLSRCVMSRVLGLYSSSCWPNHASSSLFAPSMAKWVPDAAIFTPPGLFREKFSVKTVCLSFQSDILSPPPRA